MKDGIYEIAPTAREAGTVGYRSRTDEDVASIDKDCWLSAILRRWQFSAVRGLAEPSSLAAASYVLCAWTKHEYTIVEMQRIMSSPSYVQLSIICREGRRAGFCYPRT